ncbi:MAG: ATPase, partial [Sulfurovum sp.]|nr:ATPase [Sulfurovum sp.]
KAHKTKIYVRRGGPNYEKGLKDIKEAADRLGLDIDVYGPETHVTDIVRMALEK